MPTISLVEHNFALFYMSGQLYVGQEPFSICRVSYMSGQEPFSICRVSYMSGQEPFSICRVSYMSGQLYVG